MSERAKLVVNGELREYELGCLPATISDLLEELALPGDMVVAELNGTIVKRDSFSGQTLRDGDTLELVRFVGGG